MNKKSTTNFVSTAKNLKSLIVDSHFNKINSNPTENSF